MDKLIVALLYVLLIGACVYGWVENIILLAAMNLDHMTGILVLRVAGIFVMPLGVVMGYI